MDGLFLKALELGWKGAKKKGLVEIDRKQLIDTAMKMLKTLGDESITELDIDKVISKVWRVKDETESWS